MSNVRVRFAPSPTGFVHIGSLRHKLGEKGKCIETIRNVGYQL